MNGIKIISSISVSLFLVFLSTSSLFAHVVVKPNSAGAASYQTFTVSVPNEREIPVTAIRLLIPHGLTSVMPNVKPGWTIQIKKTGESMKGEILNTGEHAPNPEDVIEIVWTGGSIPEGQRDEFLFSAKVPSKEIILEWKAYQTYKDGTLVSWDQAPLMNQTDIQREEMEEKNLGPYSETKIVNDLAKSNDETKALENEMRKVKRAVIFSSIAVVFAGISLALTWLGRKNKN